MDLVICRSLVILTRSTEAIGAVRNKTPSIKLKKQNKTKKTDDAGERETSTRAKFLGRQKGWALVHLISFNPCHNPKKLMLFFISILQMKKVRLREVTNLSKVTELSQQS